MKELSLPHIAPIRFAKNILFMDEKEARVSVSFGEIASLGMLIESAAQSCAAFGDETTSGFLVSLKNVKLLKKPTELNLEVALVNEFNLGAMANFSFKVFEGTKELVNGSLVIVKN